MKTMRIALCIIIYFSACFLCYSENIKQDTSFNIKEYLPQLLTHPINVKFFSGGDWPVPIDTLRGLTYTDFVKKFGQPYHVGYIPPSGRFAGMHPFFVDLRVFIHEIFPEFPEDKYLYNYKHINIFRAIWKYPLKKDNYINRLRVCFIAIDNELIAFYGYYYHDVGGL